MISLSYWVDTNPEAEDCNVFKGSVQACAWRGKKLGKILELGYLAAASILKTKTKSNTSKRHSCIGEPQYSKLRPNPGNGHKLEPLPSTYDP